MYYERVKLIGKRKGKDVNDAKRLRKQLVYESLSKLSLSNQTTSKQRRYMTIEGQIGYKVFILLPLWNSYFVFRLLIIDKVLSFSILKFKYPRLTQAVPL